jgi:hypothetical protein
MPSCQDCMSFFSLLKSKVQTIRSIYIRLNKYLAKNTFFSILLIHFTFLFKILFFLSTFPILKEDRESNIAFIISHFIEPDVKHFSLHC